MDHPQCDRFDGRAGESGIDIVEDRFPLVQVDGHRLEGVDQREGVGAGRLARECHLDDVLGVRRQLDYQRFAAHFAHLGHHLAGHFRLDAEGHAAALHVRAGDVQLQHVDVRVREQRRAGGIVLHAVAAHVGDEHIAEAAHSGDAGFDEGFHAGVLQSHAVHHARGGLPHADAVVAVFRMKGQPLGGDAAQTAHIVQLVVFLAEPEGPRRGNERVLERDTGDFH